MSHAKIALRVVSVLMLLILAFPAWSQQRLGKRALEQIQWLTEEKQARTPAQKKIDSRLLLANQQRKNKRFSNMLPHFKPPKSIDAQGYALVDIEAKVSDELRDLIQAHDGTVLNTVDRFDLIQAKIPLNSLEKIAGHPSVKMIHPPVPFAGSVTTEGDVAHGADVARTNFGVTGAGVKVGAMSDSVDELTDIQNAGELPAVTVLPDTDGIPGSSEGTALLEIIHDIAPDAELFFASPGIRVDGVNLFSPQQMAQNILDLQAAGCDIIVDDIFFFSEAPFQDDVIAQAVDTVHDLGVMYFSSAGNAGNLRDGTAGVFEGQFVPGTPPGAIRGLSFAHEYENGAVANEILQDSPFAFTFHWAEPLEGATSDYDLYLLSNDLSMVIDSSTNTQDGTQDPYEFIDSFDDHTGMKLVVIRTSGESRFFHLNSQRGRLEFVTDGQIFGHPAAEGAMAVAAVQRPFPVVAPFTGLESVQTFSSDGPRRIFFNADGSPVTTRGMSTSIVRPKPDITAADGVSTTSSNFNPFFGTSASAPHSAGISALFKELFPSIPVDSAYDIFRSTALDIDDPGEDIRTGSGIMMAPDALDAPIFADGFESGDASAWTK